MSLFAGGLLTSDQSIIELYINQLKDDLVTAANNLTASQGTIDQSEWAGLMPKISELRAKIASLKIAVATYQAHITSLAPATTAAKKVETTEKTTIASEKAAITSAQAAELQASSTINTLQEEADTLTNQIHAAQQFSITL